MCTEVESERSLSGLTTRAFYLIPFGAGGGEDGFVASVATEEATSGSVGGGEEEDPFLGHFKAEVAAFRSSDDLFFEELPPWVFTIGDGLNKETRETTRERKKENKKL